MVTALVLAIANLNKKNKGMSDADVIARARELGMVSSNSYSLTDAEGDKNGQTVQEPGAASNVADDNQDNDVTGTGDAADDTTASAEQNNATVTDADDTQNGDLNDEAGQAGDADQNANQNTDQNSDANQAADADQNTAADDGAGQNSTETQPAATGESVSITVSAGSGSETLAASLLRAGLIDDSKAFNTYMVDNGYSTKIRVGTFSIPVGSTYEEICKIVTGVRQFSYKEIKFFVDYP